jgi:hypothetical protein
MIENNTETLMHNIIHINNTAVKWKVTSIYEDGNNMKSSGEY